MSEIKLKKGDKVVMHTCLESKGKNFGKVWTCYTDSFKCEAGIEVVFLEGFSGLFHTKFLQPVKLDSFCKENAELRAIAENQQSSNMERYFKNKELEKEIAEAKEIINAFLDFEASAMERGCYIADDTRRRAEDFIKE